MIQTVFEEVKNIRSELVTYPSRSGRRIAAYLDHPPPSEDPPRFILMSPKYGETKKNNLQLAYYLAANGFTVLRFDFTCHFGESEGDMLAFTLPDAAQDTLASIDFLEQTFQAGRVTLLASSLSALTAFRAASLDRRIDHLVCVVGVVDLVYTLVKVYQEDLIGGFIAGRRYGVLDILGHEVDMDHFFDATIAAGMHNLDGTISAIREIRCPVSLLPASSDAWVRMEDIETVAGASPLVRVFPIEGAMHEVRENQAAAERSTREVIAICRRHSFAEAFDPDQAAAPDKRILFKQNRIERERLRLAQPIREGEDEFWGKYLGKYRVMEKMDDYQQYLDLVGSQLGTFDDGEILLDAGCGNGLFGVWILRELMQRSRRVFEVPPVYVGIDLTESGLHDAIDKHCGARRLLEPTAGNARPPALIYAQADLDRFHGEEDSPEAALRFQEDCFDKIACSLLLSYLKSPDRLLRQLHKLLRPGGRIMISSMKPFCDLSSIYRDFVEQKAARQDIDSARELLRAAGAIKVKQEQGYYAFFSDEELTSLLTGAGFRDVKTFSSLGNQAYVAVGTK
jgi:SAM-dependent methyltransferase